MRKVFTALALAVLALAGSAAPAQAQAHRNGPEWPAAYGALPQQAPVATFSNNQNTVRCGVYTIEGRDFVKCLSFVDTMPGHQCYKRGQVNAMMLGTGDAWNCANKNDFAGAPAMGPLQFRRINNVIVFSDHAGNFIIGDRWFNRVIRVGTIGDIAVDRGKIIAFNSPLRGSSLPAGSSL